MLSSDRSESRARRRRRKPGRGATGADQTGRSHGETVERRAQVLHEPWDAESAEALTRLYESDEGQLHKPHAGERVRCAQATAHAPGTGEAGAPDRAWLESLLADLAGRLQASVDRLDTDKPVVALSRRLEALEERFSVALERVAQRTDLEGLRTIEAHVLELAAHLERTRDRLEQIGGLEEQVRGLAQRLDEGEQQRLATLGRLLRDYVAEWRESEQRTAGALHNLEEAISRLGDTVDAMEASKPAPDLSLPTLAAPQPARMAGDPLAQIDAASDRAVAPRSYHAMLDAADYAPKEAAGASFPGAADESARAGAKRGIPALPAAAIQWSAEPADAVHAGRAARQAGARASRIMAGRERLRRSEAPDANATGEDGRLPDPEPDLGQPNAIKRTRPSLLLLAGVAFLAGGAYLLIQALTTTPQVPTSPATVEPGARTTGAQPDLADPTPHPFGPAGAG
jgi:hypothetical protein